MLSSAIYLQKVILTPPQKNFINVTIVLVTVTYTSSKLALTMLIFKRKKRSLPAPVKFAKNHSRIKPPQLISAYTPA